MDEVTGLTKNNNGDFVRGEARENRENFIFRPRRNRREGGGQKKHVLVSDWDPRNPDISKILRDNKDTLYRDPVNRRLFPPGSVIAGFRRRRNLGEMVAPTVPRRVPRPRPGSGSDSGGCGPCDANRCQIHRNLVTATNVISPWDGRAKKIRKSLKCTDKNLVYYLICTQCPMGPNLTPHYVGSSVNFRGHRWSKHKVSMEKGNGKDCHFCEHWAVYHKDNLQDLSCVKIYFLDSCEDPGPAEEDYPLLRKLEEKWMITLGSLAALDPLQGCNKRDDAKANAWRSGGL